MGTTTPVCHSTGTVPDLHATLTMHATQDSPTMSRAFSVEVPRQNYRVPSWHTFQNATQRLQEAAQAETPLSLGSSEKDGVQPLFRSLVPEPVLCTEVSPTISSWYRSTSRTSSGSFPEREVPFHVPRASLPPGSHCTRPQCVSLRVVGPRCGGSIKFFFGLCPPAPHVPRPGHLTLAGDLSSQVWFQKGALQLLVVKEEQQEWSSSLDQEDPEPPHIKEKQEELWTSQEGEQLQGLEEADIKFPFTLFTVKSEEDDEEEAQSSQLHQRQTEQMETEADGEDCGGPEPDRNSDPDTHLQPHTYDKTGDSSEPETEHSDDWTETREPESGLNSLKNDEVSGSDSRCSTNGKPFSCSVCGKTFGFRGNLKSHIKCHTGEKPFSCSVCEKSYTQSRHLQRHMRTHTGEKPFSCSVCDRSFIESGDLKRHIRTHTDVEQLLVVNEEQQEWSSSLNQGDPEPPHIKEEQEDLRTSQEGEQLQGLEEADIKFSFTVKSEDAEEKAQSSQLHQRQTEQMETEADGEDCEGPEPDENSDPDSPLQPAADDETSPSSECDTDDSRDWEETKKPQSNSSHLQNNVVPRSDTDCNTGKTSISSSECAGRFNNKRNLKKHTKSKTGVKPFSCSVCGKTFKKRSGLIAHLRIHTGEKLFTCSVCEKTFKSKGEVETHQRIHTGEKPFSCSVYSKTFTQQSNLKKHMTVHTVEKPFSCSVCSKTFTQQSNPRKHPCVDDGEKTFTCGVCETRFTRLVLSKKQVCSRNK
ncbi:zinc finger protein 599-like [Anarrhichthys ocellatus]|uniref:zinc finger protein 599-like n=1 Tax=Anarrhichthys ocellatus TaxID=433405 RepID=UPI0012EE16BF|nr:zinc finger protein 599-like [Anarrhichthys ocellatus]